MAGLYTPKQLYTPTSLYPKTSLYTPKKIYSPNYTQNNPTTAPDYGVTPNNPYQINSILDVISNEAALKKAYGTNDASARFKALRDLFVQRTWNPVKQGDFGTAGLSLLYNLGETLDVFGNISKAVFTPWVATDAAKVDYATAEHIVVLHNTGKTQVKSTDIYGRKVYGAMVNGQYISYTDQDLEQYENIVNSGRTVNPYKLSTSERVKASLGLGDYGRINYEYATGSTIADIFLEVLSDPETLIDLGGAALAKAVGNTFTPAIKAAMQNLDTAALKGVTDEAAQQLIKDALNQVSDEAVSGAMQKKAMKYFLDKKIIVNANESAKMWLPGFLGKALKTTDIESTYAVKNLSDAITLALYYDGKAAGNIISVEQTSDLLQRSLTKRVNGMTTTVLRTLNTAGKVIDDTQSALTKAALSSAGIYPVYKLLSSAPKVAKWITNTLGASTEPYTNANGLRSILSYMDGIENYKKTNKTIIDGIGDELAVNYNPRYIDQFHPQMAEDQVFFGDFFDQLTSDNADEMLGKLNKYMTDNHHGKTLAELAEAAQQVLRVVDDVDPETQIYANYMSAATEQMAKIENSLVAVRKVNAINNTVTAIAAESVPIAHINLLREQLKKGVNVVTAVGSTMQQLDSMLDELIAPVQALTSATPELTATFKQDMHALYTRYFDVYFDLLQTKAVPVTNVPEIQEIMSKLSLRLSQYSSDLTDINMTYFKNGVSALQNRTVLQSLSDLAKLNKNTFDDFEKAARKVNAHRTAAVEAEVASKLAVGDYNVVTSTMQILPSETPLVKEVAFKDTFKDVDFNDAESIKTWYQTYYDKYFKEISTTYKTAPVYKELTHDVEDVVVNNNKIPFYRLQDLKDQFNIQSRFTETTPQLIMSTVPGYWSGQLKPKQDALDIITNWVEHYTNYIRQLDTALEPIVDGYRADVTKLYSDYFDKFYDAYLDNIPGHGKVYALDQAGDVTSLVRQRTAEYEALLTGYKTPVLEQIATYKTTPVYKVTEAPIKVPIKAVEVQELQGPAEFGDVYLLENAEKYILKYNSMQGVLDHLSDAFHWEYEKFRSPAVQIAQEAHTNIAELYAQYFTAVKAARNKANELNVRFDATKAELPDLAGAVKARLDQYWAEATAAYKALSTKNITQQVPEHVATKELIHDAEEITKTIIVKKDASLFVWKPETVVKTIQAFFNTPLNSTDYAKGYNKFVFFIQNLDNDMTKLTATPSKLKDMLPALQQISPQALNRRAKELTAWETTYQFKLENLTTFVETLEDDTTKKFMVQLKNGDFGRLSEQFLTDTKAAKMEGTFEAIQNVADMTNQYYVNKELITSLGNAGLSESTKSGVMASMQNLRNTKPEQLATDIDRQLKRLISRTETFVQQSAQHDESLSLEFIKQKYMKSGTVSHIAANDLDVTDYVLQNMVNDAPEVKQLLESGRVRVYFDFETQNAAVGMANQLHQVAVNVIKDGTNDAITMGIRKEAIQEFYLPDKDYLDKLFPGKTFAEQKVLYLSTRCGDVVDEKTLVAQTVNTLWAAVKDTYDEAADAYTAALVTHNGLEFDLPLLKKKIYQYGLNTSLSEAGVDLNFLDQVQMFDTLKLLRDKKGYFHVNMQTEYPILQRIFKKYGEDMSACHARKLFTTVTSADLKYVGDSVIKATDALQQYYGLSAQQIAGFRDGLAGMLDALGKIKETNSRLAETAWPKALFTSALENGNATMTSADKKVWYDYFRAQGMTPQQIVDKYGSFDSLTASSILGSYGPYQPFAYVYDVNTKLVDRFFVSSAARVTATPKDLQVMSQVARTLQEYAKKIYNPGAYQAFTPHVKRLCDMMLHGKLTGVNTGRLLDTTLGTPSYFKYLRTENLNLQEQWALFRFLKESFDWAPAYLSSPTPEVQDILDLLSSRGGIELGYKNKYFDVDEYVNAASEYTQKYQKLLNLQSNFDQMSRYLDDPGIGNAPIFDGASQLQQRAMQPMLDITNTLQQGYKQVLEDNSVRAQKNAYVLYQKEAEGSDLLAHQIVSAFVRTDLDSTVQWLADSKGLVTFRQGEFATDEFEAVINKFSSPEFRAANIKMYTEGEYTYVWLSKEAGLRATLDEDLNTVTYWVNGKAYEKAKWNQLDLSNAVYDGYTAEIEDEYPDLLGRLHRTKEIKSLLTSDAIHSADDALYFMTEGASGASMYENFSQTNLDDLIAKLPQSVRDDLCDLDSIKSPAMWKGPQFNHTVLGSTASRQGFLPYSTGHVMSTMQDATYRRVQDHGTKFVYAQAVMSTVSAVQNTRIGKIMQSDPVAAAKWFSKNPEYQAAALVKSKNSLGFELIKFDLTSAAGVTEAFKANANIMSMPELNKAWEVINQNIFSESQANTWLTLVRLYKIGYLATPGTWVRNLYDTLIKNTQVTGEDPITVMKHYGAAISDLRAYDQVVQDMKAWTKDGAYPSEEELIAYFSEHGSMTYDKYQYLHRFFNDAAAGGESAVYRKLNTVDQDKYWNDLLQAGNITPEIKKKLETKRSFNNITNAALNPMNEVERTARLAEYEMLTKQGLTNTKAIYLIEKTHYAYSVKTKLEQTMELMIPFYTFASRNLAYWMEVMEKDPAFMVAMRDILDPVWDLSQYDPEELETSNSLRSNVMSGNIPLGDSNWFLKTSFSFMDAFQILSNPVDQAKSRVFSPVQTVLDVLLQHSADASYHEGRKAVSQWIQNTFGAKITREQLEVKYGEWAKTYEELYPYKVSSENPMADLLTAFHSAQYIPLIGTQISRFENTGLYYDGEGINSLFYLAGFAGKREPYSPEDLVNNREKLRYKISALVQDSSQVKAKWESILKSRGYGDSVNLYMLNYDELKSMWDELSTGYQKLNTQLYNLLQGDDDQVWMYTRLKAAMGYADVSMKNLPVDVKELILSVMNDQMPTVDIRPVLQDADTMTFMWNSLKRKYGYDDAQFAEIPVKQLDIMYTEIARSATVLTEVITMLNNDATTRYSYSVAKKKLGYGDLKLSMLPCDSLELIKAAMTNKVYGSGYTQNKFSGYQKRPSTKRVYHKKTWTNQTPYDTHNGVYANYGHNQASMAQYKSSHNSVYENNYTKTGRSRMEMRMLPVTPNNINTQIKDMFSYYR